MFIKYIDYLSPRITFYYKGFLSHSSIVSGIISIISIIFIVILVVYFSLDIIQRKGPNTSYFKSFTEDAGIYQINTSSLFHFINIVKIDRGSNDYEEFNYSDIGDSNFEWPKIAHGTFNESNILYGLYIQKCNNYTIKQLFGNEYFCKSEEKFFK